MPSRRPFARHDYVASEDLGAAPRRKSSGVLRRSVVLAALTLLGGGWASSPTHKTLAASGLSVRLPSGWHGVATPGQLQAADFPLDRRALDSPELARVGRGHVHLIVWDYGRSVPYLAGNFTPIRLPLALGRRDLSSGPLEGFSWHDLYAVRSVLIGGEMLEVIADLGPKPLAANSFAKVNHVLATLRVQPPRFVRAHNGRVEFDGVALRLPPGWSGQIEIPTDLRAGQFVLRADRGGVHVVLLQLAGGGGAHADLPIVLAAKNVFRHRGLTIARRVFSTAGRSFDLSVALPSLAALGEANRMLRTLTARPRPWTFRSCDLTLRLPGTWRAAINPRSGGCYPIITLSGPRLRVILSELRPRERAHGRVLARAGRRFEVDVQPPAGRQTADEVLTSLRAKRR
jgi:hypothetical protein